MRSISRAGRAEAGYSYIAALLVLVALALFAQVTWRPATSLAQREAEAELIFRGRAYRDAIAAYWAAGGLSPSLPKTLADLERDSRFEGRRHIRRLYSAVFGDSWRVIRAGDGGIMGVSPNVADRRPFRRPRQDSGITVTGEGASYADWAFIFDPDDLLSK